MLLSKGATIDETCRDGKIALFHATLLGHLGQVRFLLRRGANIHVFDKDGNQPLIMMARAAAGCVIVRVVKVQQLYLLQQRM